MAIALLPDPDLAPDAVHRRRTVLVAIGGVDRRDVEAIRHALRVPADDRRAVHVGPDDEGVAAAWCAHFPDGLPLELVAGPDVAAAVADEARRTLHDGAAEVLVVIGRLAGRGLRRRLLHDGTADAIAAAIAAVPGATAEVVSVAT